jgi:hypothetical protein
VSYDSLKPCLRAHQQNDSVRAIFS